MRPSLVDLISDPPRLVFPDGISVAVPRSVALAEALRIVKVSPLGVVPPAAPGGEPCPVDPKQTRHGAGDAATLHGGSTGTAGLACSRSTARPAVNPAPFDDCGRYMEPDQ